MLKKEGKYIFMSRQRQNYKKAWCDEVWENAKTHLGAQIATINSLSILSVGGSQCVCASWWMKIVMWNQKISFKASNCQWSGSEINISSQILTLSPCNVKYVGAPGEWPIPVCIWKCRANFPFILLVRTQFPAICETSLWEAQNRMTLIN